MNAKRSSRPSGLVSVNPPPGTALAQVMPTDEGKESETSLVIRNSQRVRKLSMRAVRGLLEAFLRAQGITAELGVVFVSSRKMADANWRFLRHEGSTDVITFDHGSTQKHLKGDILISISDAVNQAEDFRTHWEEETSRYLIHALLHLLGFDDKEPTNRRRMKREENRWLRRMQREGWVRLQR